MLLAQPKQLAQQRTTGITDIRELTWTLKRWGFSIVMIKSLSFQKSTYTVIRLQINQACVKCKKKCSCDQIQFMKIY